MWRRSMDVRLPGHPKLCGWSVMLPAAFRVSVCSLDYPSRPVTIQCCAEFDKTPFRFRANSLYTTSASTIGPGASSSPTGLSWSIWTSVG